MVVLIVFLLVFFVLLLGMTAFEFSRYSLCCQQFQHCVDIAALGGAAGLASSQTTNQAAAQTVAISTAQWMMEQNYVLDKSLNGKTTWSAGTTTPPTPSTANTATVAFTWVDPETGLPTGVAGDQKVFRIYGTYAYPPLVGSWIGLGNSTKAAVVAIGDGGGATLDVVLCFDLSGSIDDSTKVSYVERYMTGVTPGPANRNKYRKVVTYGDGTMYKGANCSSLTGTSINACYPQSIQSTDSTRVSGQGNLRYDNVERGVTQGGPPGKAGPAADTRTLTDIVVNLDENDVFGGYSSNGFNFPNIGTLVEASRGNLESAAIATSANVDTSALGVTPQTGYYQEYWKQALLHRHPLYDAQLSSANFYQILNNAVNAHFGFVGFSSDENTTYTDDCIGNPSTHTFTAPPAGPYPTTGSGGVVRTPIPYVCLDPIAGSAHSNFSTIMQYLPPNNPVGNYPGGQYQLTANGGTDINGSLNQALNMLARTSAPDNWANGLNTNRQGANRAIVLFTDGLPNGNTGPVGASDGLAIASACNSMSIPIYCVGLAQIPALVPSMTAALQPIATNSKGKFYQIPPGTGQAAALDRAFSDIARSLISLTR